MLISKLLKGGLFHIRRTGPLSSVPMRIMYKCSRGSSPLRNAVLLSTAFMLIFTGYNCSVNLLSSLNIEEGMGVASQSVLYAAFVLSAFSVPTICMRKIGVKKTVAFSAMLYSPYVAANFYPSWYTFIPSAILIGVAAGPLWASAMSYLTAMAKRRGGDDSALTDSTIAFYCGLLFTFFGLSNIFGNIVSFYVLKPDEGYSDVNLTRESLELCGVNFCDKAAIDSGIIVLPPKEKIWFLTGLYVACVLAGALLSLFCLENITLAEVGVDSDTESLKDLLTAPLKRFQYAQHWYLIPITIFAGVEESFLFGDYTKAYVACSWGIYHIGLSMISCGVVLCVASFLLGLLVKVIDRAWVFLSASLLQAATIVILWYWTPDTPKYVLYIIPAVWGLVTAVWQSQVRALYGILFPDAKGSAFAVQIALEAIGFLIGFAISSHICTEPKLWLLSGLLALSMIGYAATEVSHRSSRAQVLTLNSTLNIAASQDTIISTIRKEA